jgi:putative ABC transport system ATP-binding protein
MRTDAQVAAVELSDVRFGWRASKSPLLDFSTIRIERGEKVFLAGPSGSGKSTLLGLMSGVLLPQAGSVRVLGQAWQSMSASQRDRYRADHLGVIFQMFNLVPYLSVLENVLLPLKFSKLRLGRLAQPEREARELLDRLGIGAEMLGRPAGELSVGEQQRTAAVRALLGQPEVVIADEPTSALDADNRDAFLELLLAEVERSGAALIFVSHDRSLASRFDRVVELADLRAGAR